MSLIEVARRAGVSKSVVSDILSGNMKCSYRSETVERVRATAQEVGYRPHTTASLMRAKRTYMIGIFTASLRGSCSALMANALVQELRKHPPYRPMFVDPSVLREDDGTSFGFELLEGLLWSLPSRDDDLLRALLARPGGRPQIVTVGRKYPRDFAVSGVLVGLGDGAYQATEHLLQLGHRRIAILYRAPRQNNDRFAGYGRAMKAHGAPVLPEYCLAMPDEYGVDSYYRAGLELTRRLFQAGKKPPTAIVCHNDEVAVGVLQAAHQLGLAVPRDLSVVGFDGVPLAHYTIPRLTTLEQPIERQAEAAMQLLLARLSGGGAQREFIKLACTLRVGESSAPPRAGA